MKDKHIHIKEDSELLKYIYEQIDLRLVRNENKFAGKILLKFLFYFPLSVLCYLLIFYTTQPLHFIFSYVLYGIVTLLFAFNFSHDFSHNTVFKNKNLNNICFTMLYTIVGAHAEAWKKRHVNSHHYAPNVENYDSDLKISKLIRVIPKSEYRWYHKYQYIYAPVAYTTYSLFWVFVKDFVILFSPDEYGTHRGLGYHLSFWAQKIVYIIIAFILPLWFSSFSWYIVLAGFLIMHLSQSLFLLFTFFMTHHVEQTAYPTTDENGYINASWLMNQIKSSNDMHPFSPLANFILGGFNNHIAHHLFPHYHHVYYPELNKILYEILIQKNIIPNQTTYWGGVVSHIKLLKKMSNPEN